MRGRIPQATAIKVLNGNPGKRRLNEDEPMPEGTATRPGWLKPEAVVVWDELAPALEGVGLLTSADGETFGWLCTLTAEFRKDSAGMSANRISRMDALSQRFGMDPASRTRIKVRKPDGADSRRRKFGLI